MTAGSALASRRAANIRTVVAFRPSVGPPQSSEVLVIEKTPNKYAGEPRKSGRAVRALAGGAGAWKGYVVSLAINCGQLHVINPMCTRYGASPKLPPSGLGTAIRKSGVVFVGYLQAGIAFVIQCARINANSFGLQRAVQEAPTRDHLAVGRSLYFFSSLGRPLRVFVSEAHVICGNKCRPAVQRGGRHAR